MKILLLVISILYVLISFSQNTIKLNVKDSKTKEPLQFCNVLIEGTTKGTVTNSYGDFSLTVDISRDVILFSYLGYHKLAISAKKLQYKKEVLLVAKDIVLQEVIISSGNDYLYTYLTKCRKKIIANKVQNISKVYYGLETQSKELPIELLECYYNGHTTGTAIDEYGFKNGRVGLATVDGNYFLSMNSSKAISNIELAYNKSNFPTIPLQCSKSKMKKLFMLELISMDSTIYNIKFYPKKDDKTCFSGELWFDKETFDLIKINLKADNMVIHPFLPLFDTDSLYNVSLDISNTYKLVKGSMVPDYINFNYKFFYKSVRDKSVVTLPKIITREIFSEGLIYFYDYGDSFILPNFEYDNQFGDYRKMSFIPYNEVFWENNHTLLLTEKQKENICFFSENGQLLNYRADNYGSNFKLGISNFESYYSFWSPTNRIILNGENPQNMPYSQVKINQSIQTDLYFLKVQILLDVTQLKDSIHYKSYTVFDSDKTYYHLPENESTRAFLNIYFDICEIERRKMEDNLLNNHNSISQVNAIYKKAIINMHKITSTYLKEVKQGKNLKETKKWNNYIEENLNINNIKMLE